MTDTSILDSLTPVAPPAPKQSPAAATAPTADTDQKGPTSTLDSLSPVNPTRGMIAAGYKPAQPTERPRLPDWARLQQPQQPNAAPPQAEPSWSNLGGAVPSGLYSGVAKAANIPTYAINAGSALIKNLGGEDLGQLKAPIETNPTNYQPVGGAAQNIYNASEAVGNVASMGAAGRFLAPLMPAGSVAETAANAVSHVTPGTLAAAGAGGAVEELAASLAPEGMKPAARVLANVAAGGATSGLENAVRGAAEPTVAALAQQARDVYDIPIRAGQISGNRIVRTADSALQSVPFSGMQGAAEEQQTAFNRAISQTFGENASQITPQVLNQARRRIGGVMNDIEGSNSVQFDQPLQDSLAGIENNARTALTDQEFGVVRRQLDNVLSTVQPGDQISGTTYGNLIHKGAPLDAMLSSSNPNISSYGSQIRDALRDSLQRSLNGEDLQAYQTARAQWKNMKTIEPLTQRADVVGGASPTSGDIIPAQLRGVVNRSFGNSAYAEPGQIPLNDLANIGQRFLKETPSSHTSERSNIFRWLERGGALAGGLVGGEHYLGIPIGEMALPAAVAGATTLGLGRGAGSALNSNWLANRMIQGGLGGRAAPSMVERGAPLITSATTRNLEGPQQSAPATSINPATRLPEFSLKANQAAPAANAAISPSDVGQKLMDGSLATHKDVQGWIDQNKRGLRSTLGGQGLQNIAMMASLLRRAQTEPGAPSTVLSLLANGTPPKGVIAAAQSAGVSDPADLIGLALSHPPLAREMATKIGGQGRIGRMGEARLASLIQTAAGGADSGTDDGALSGSPRLGNNPVAGQGQRSNPAQVGAAA